LLQFVPRHLRPRREKIFGPAPEHRLDGNAKARVWAAAAAYNSANRRPGQHQGPLTWATLRVLRALLWRFHGADGGGRCFPSYERIAAVAKCARSSVAVAIRALEDAGILSWINRIARIRRQERDLFGDIVEHAALIARLDSRGTKADWAAYDRELDALLAAGSR